MGKAIIVINVQGLDGMIDALKLVDRPSFLVTGELEKVLDQAFAKTQSVVHVISERLKASGHTSTDFNGKVWEGSINYGGVSGTPAYYAIYELNHPGTRPDGTPHDFFSGLEVLDHSFEEAIDSHFKALG